MKWLWAILALISFCFYGCIFGPSTNGDAKLNPKTCQDNPSIELSFFQSGGNAPLVFDSALYRTPAGTPFSVENLQYYVSGFEFYDANDALLFKSDSVFYIDARDSATWMHRIQDVNSAHYHSYVFTFGLAPAKNRTNALANTIENLNMAWPEPMGGGYHFMKLEGRLIDSLGRAFGFYLHIGDLAGGNIRQENQFKYSEENFPIHATLTKGTHLSLGIEMVIPNWFTGVTPLFIENNPQNIMGDSASQNILQKNGALGAFRTKSAKVMSSMCD